jgi:serine/threonine-protein kinase
MSEQPLPHPVNENSSDLQLDAGLAAAFGPDSAPPAAPSTIPLALREPRDDTPAAPHSDEPPAGTAGRNLLFGEIARGGMGAVLRGRDSILGRELAVKVLLEAHRDKPELVQRFLEEAQIGGQLQHPGVVPVYELGRFDDDRPFFTMKLVKGQTLAKLLAERASPQDNLPRFLTIFEQVCQTVAYAHARGVIHRDLKPSNIMVGGFGEVQVMDWGLAKVLKEGAIADKEQAQTQQAASVIQTRRSTDTSDVDSDTQAGSVLGTPTHMAPEQARGEVVLVDTRADVFGLGAILCEILTGQPPFTGQRAEATRKAQTAQLDDAFRRLGSCGADAELISLAQRCLAAEPWDRPRDAGAVASAVTAYQNAVAERLRQAELAGVEARAKAGEERKRRKLTVALASSLLFSVLLGSGAWVWVAEQKARQERQLAALELKQARRRQEIGEALARATTLRDEALARDGHVPWAKVRDAVQLARGLMEGGDPEPTLQSRMETLLEEVTDAEKDSQLLAALDAARLVLAQYDAATGLFAHERAIPLYRSALREYGMPVGEGNVQESAARLLKRPVAVREALAAEFDLCIALAENHMLPFEELELSWLKSLVDAVSQEGWASKVRAAAAEPNSGRRRERLEELAEEAEVARLPARSLHMLSWRLRTVQSYDSAFRLLRRTHTIYPGDFWVNWDLGMAFIQVERNVSGQQKLAAMESGLRYFTAAVALRPENAMAHNNLGAALRLLGRWDEAGAAFRQAIALDPKFALAHSNLGIILVLQGQTDLAIPYFRKAVYLSPAEAMAHSNLGYALELAGMPEEGIAEYRKAIAIDGKLKNALANLANALRRKGELQNAIEWYDKLLEIDPKDATSRLSLERTIRMAAVHEKLPAFLKGEFKPETNEERLGLAFLCGDDKRPLAAATLLATAFASDRTLAENMNSLNRYDAACFAALAAAGQGVDANKLDETERSRLRKQVFVWLRADLAHWSKLATSDQASDRELVQKHLAHWQTDTDLAGVRDKNALAKLPEAERDAWRKLWDDVALVLNKAADAK